MWESDEVIVTFEVEESFSCLAGTYLPENQTTCEICPAGYYCPGGTRINYETEQGKFSCPTYKDYVNGGSSLQSPLPAAAVSSMKNTYTNACNSVGGIVQETSAGGLECLSLISNMTSEKGASSISNCYLQTAKDTKFVNGEYSLCDTDYESSAKKISYGSTKSCTRSNITFQANICSSPVSLSCSNWITFTVVKGTTYKDALTGRNYTSFICYTNSEGTSVLNTELAENGSQIYCKFGTRGGNANTSTSCSDTIPTMKCTSTNKGDYYFDWSCTFSHKVCGSYYSAKVDNQLGQGPAAGINRSTTYTNRSMYGTLNGITCKYCSYDGSEPCISGTFDANNECTPTNSSNNVCLKTAMFPDYKCPTTYTCLRKDGDNFLCCKSKDSILKIHEDHCKEPMLQ